MTRILSFPWKNPWKNSFCRRIPDGNLSKSSTRKQSTLRPPAYPAAPAIVQPAAPEQDVERLHKDLSQQIQSVAQSLQAEIEKLAEQMHQRQEPLKTLPESAPNSSAAQESSQQEFHRRLVEIQVAWDQVLTAMSRELSLGQSVVDEWLGDLSEVRQIMNRTQSSRLPDKKTGTDIAPAA